MVDKKSRCIHFAADVFLRGRTAFGEADSDQSKNISADTTQSSAAPLSSVGVTLFRENRRKNTPISEGSAILPGKRRTCFFSEKFTGRIPATLCATRPAELSTFAAPFSPFFTPHRTACSDFRVHEKFSRLSLLIQKN